MPLNDSVTESMAISHLIHSINGDYGYLSIQKGMHAKWLSPFTDTYKTWSQLYVRARTSGKLDAAKIRDLQEKLPPILDHLKKARAYAESVNDQNIRSTLERVQANLEELRDTDVETLTSKTYSINLSRYADYAHYLHFKIGEAVKRFQVQCNAAGQPHEFQVSEMEPPELFRNSMFIIDNPKVVEAVEQLIRNAHVHGNRKGPTIVSINMEQAAQAEHGRAFIRISVSSTGEPISPATAKAIMKGKLTTTMPDGFEHGLGMRFVHGVVKGHGGRLSIESVRDGPHNRNVFSIILPQVPKDVDETWRAGNHSFFDAFTRRVEI